MPHYERTKSAELMSAFFMFCWGIFLLWPVDTFSSASAYRILAELAPEPRWASIAILLAIFQTISLNAHRCAFGQEGRIIAAISSLIWWVILGVLSFQGNPYGHAWVMYACLAVTMVYSLHHIAQRDSHGKECKPTDGQPDQA